MSLDARNSRRGPSQRGATSTQRSEREALEEEFPGGSWIATRVGRELEVVGAQVEAFVAAVARRHGLSHAALNALAVIEAEGGPIASGEIGERMHITSGTMSSILNTLERNGYVERRIDPEDRRRIKVTITAVARDALDRLLPEVVQAITVALEPLEEADLEALLHLLGAVRTAIEHAPEHLPPPAPRRTPQRLRTTSRPT